MDVASFMETIMEFPIPRERVGKIKKKSGRIADNRVIFEHGTFQL
jgi:hypothetical protein